MDSGIYWSMIETKEVYSKNRLSKHVYSRKNAFYGDMSICITTLALPIRRTFEYSRTNQGFDSTNLWRHMIRRIHDSASNIRIFGFDRIKMPFTEFGPDGNRTYIILYVDDLLIMSEDSDELANLKLELSIRF